MRPGERGRDGGSPAPPPGGVPGGPLPAAPTLAAEPPKGEAPASDEAPRPGSAGNQRAAAKPVAIKANRSLAGNIVLRAKRPGSAGGVHGKKSSQPDEVTAELQRVEEQLGSGGMNDTAAAQPAAPQPSAAANLELARLVQMDARAAMALLQPSPQPPSLAAVGPPALTSSAAAPALPPAALMPVVPPSAQLMAAPAPPPQPGIAAAVSSQVPAYLAQQQQRVPAQPQQQLAPLQQQQAATAQKQVAKQQTPQPPAAAANPSASAAAAPAGRKLGSRRGRSSSRSEGEIGSGSSSSSSSSSRSSSYSSRSRSRDRWRRSRSRDRDRRRRSRSRSRDARWRSAREPDRRDQRWRGRHDVSEPRPYNRDRWRPDERRPDERRADERRRDERLFVERRRDERHPDDHRRDERQRDPQRDMQAGPAGDRHSSWDARDSRPPASIGRELNGRGSRRRSPSPRGQRRSSPGPAANGRASAAKRRRSGSPGHEPAAGAQFVRSRSPQPAPPPRQVTPRSPDISDRLRQLAATYGVDFDAASGDQLVRLVETMFTCANAPEPEETFERQQQELDALARRLPGAGPMPADARPPPFSGDQWCWQLPDSELIPDDVHAPPRRLPLQPADEEAGEGAAGGAAPTDPRTQPAVAAELAAAREWYGRGEAEPPAFACPVLERADSGLSWSENPRPEGQQQEASSAAPPAEERAQGDGDDLYAPAAPRHDDAFHRSVGATLASGGRVPPADRPAEIEEGFWQALLPDLSGRTTPRQLDVLQEQARAGQLVPGWPVYRASDRLHCYLTDNPPALADLAWPNPRPSPGAARWVADGAAAEGAQQQGQPGAAKEQQEQAALEQLQQRAAARHVGLSSHPAVTDMALQWPPALLVAAAAAATDDGAGDEAWLRGAARPQGAAADLQSAVSAQRRALAAGQRLPRSYGRPAPQHVAAAVRELLLTRRNADNAMRKVLAEVAARLVAERAAARRAAAANPQLGR